MRFEKLKLSGFKSFVEPAELRIEPGLTGIVGPNGCGKSNLLEALRWVMGESSAKSMRGGGMDDVIFAGTSTRPARSFAEVVLFARRSLASNDDAGTELEVARRIERAAGSAYRINGREVRAKDVALVFADAATGAHSPALVSQGRIAAVIAAKPAERRVMLEEAAGIAGLHVRRRDAEARLRATEANLGRLDELLAGLAAKIAVLRRQARAAERYRALSDQIKLADARVVFARWREAADAAAAARQEAETAEAAVSAAQHAAKQAQNQQHGTAATLAKARDGLAKDREKVSAHGHALATLVGKREAAEQRLADIDRQIARLSTDHGEAGQVTGKASTALMALRADLATAEQALQQAEHERPELVARQAQAEQAVRTAELALAQAQAEQAGAEAEWRVAEAAVASARSALTRIMAERTKREQQQAALLSGDQSGQQLAEAQAAVQRAREARAEAEAQRDTLAGERAGLVTARDAAAEMLAGLRAELAGLEHELAALQRARAARDGQRGGSAAITRLRAAPGYERALGAVLGRDGNALLGKPADGAPGRYWAGAPPLEPLADSLALHVPVAPPELAARLARVRFAEHDDGRPLAPGEWLVTGDGDVRRWDGFLARGEGASEAASLEAANRLATLEAELPVRQAVRREAESEAAQAAAKLADSQARLATAEQTLAMAAAAERTALRSHDQAESAVERQRSRSAEIASALAETVENAAQLAADLAAAEQRRDGLPEPSEGRARLEQRRTEQATARHEHQAASIALATHDRQLGSWRERRTLLRADIRNWEARMDDADRRIAEFARRQDELAGERNVLAAGAAGMREELAAAETVRAVLGTGLAAAEATTAECEIAAGKAERALAAASEALATAREARAGAVARAESLESWREEAARLSGERFACPPPLLPGRFGFAATDTGDAAGEAAQMERLLAERERLGAVNLVAAAELATAEEQHGETAAEQGELTEAVHRLRGSIGNLNREGRERLRAAFAAVDSHFRRLFARLFNGGSAELAMIDSDDPLEAGLEIFAQPPGKRLQSLTLLSGGEQALTAVALIFALFLTKPSPICVLDEVDAPLDDANVERFCDLLDAMVAETETRYLIVTHNAVTMSRMHRLFGVTMVEQGVSRLVSVDLGGAEELLAAE